MEPINFFNSVEHLDPHCPECNNKIDYGVTTKYDDEKEAHICLDCGLQV